MNGLDFENVGFGLAEAIHKNRAREARFDRARRVLHNVRLKTFEYEDAGKLDKAVKVMNTCRRILQPRLEAYAIARLRSQRKAQRLLEQLPASNVE